MAEARLPTFSKLQPGLHVPKVVRRRLPALLNQAITDGAGGLEDVLLFAKWFTIKDQNPLGSRLPLSHQQERGCHLQHEYRRLPRGMATQRAGVQTIHLWPRTMRRLSQTRQPNSTHAPRLRASYVVRWLRGAITGDCPGGFKVHECLLILLYTKCVPARPFIMADYVSSNPLPRRGIFRLIL